MTRTARPVPPDRNAAALRVRADRAELAERIARATPTTGVHEVADGLLLRRETSPTEPVHGVSDPSFCLIAQGAKEVHLGARRYRYDAHHYLLLTAELPIVGHVVEASPERPYLSLQLLLDPALVSEVLTETGGATGPRRAEAMALDVSPLGADLLDAAVRVVRLLDAPAEAPVIGPLVNREIVYRLLVGDQGGRLSHVAVVGGHSHRIAAAVRRLHAEFDRPIAVESLADDVGLSPSRFHHHFKAVTGFTPVQFQKRLRLQEAQRLLLGDDVDATSAGYRVGYNDPSHFSRDYKRLFGAPPVRDIERRRAALDDRPG